MIVPFRVLGMSVLPGAFVPSVGLLAPSQWQLRRVKQLFHGVIVQFNQRIDMMPIGGTGQVRHAHSGFLDMLFVSSIDDGFRSIGILHSLVKQKAGTVLMITELSRCRRTAQRSDVFKP